MILPRWILKEYKEGLDKMLKREKKMESILKSKVFCQCGRLIAPNQLMPYHVKCITCGKVNESEHQME